MVNRKTAAKTGQIGYWVTRSGYVGKDRELSHLSLNNEPLVGPTLQLRPGFAANSLLGRRHSKKANAKSRGKNQLQAISRHSLSRSLFSREICGFWAESVEFADKKEKFAVKFPAPGNLLDPEGRADSSVLTLVRGDRWTASSLKRRSERGWTIQIGCLLGCL